MYVPFRIQKGTKATGKQTVQNFSSAENFPTGSIPEQQRGVCQVINTQKGEMERKPGSREYFINTTLLAARKEFQ
jgi:hypothetical protein